VPIQTMMMNTHSQGVILFFNKQDWGTNLKFEMSNEPYFEIFINAFSKHHEFILWQIIDGFEWRWCTFFKINCAIIWSMLWHGVNILLLKHILVYFVWKNISYWCDSTSGLGKHKSRIHLFIYHMHKSLCSHEQQFGTLGFSCTTKGFLMFEILDVSISCFSLNAWFLPNMLVLKSSHFKASCFGGSKWKFFICQSTCGLCKATQNDPMMMGFLGMKWYWRQFC